MKILVINCGSSSIKYKLYEMDDRSVLAAGGIERVGLPGAFLKTTVNGEKVTLDFDCPTHTEGIKKMFDTLLDPQYGAISSIDEIAAAGHRIVAGGRFAESRLVTDDMLEEWKTYMDLAPLHNPPALKGYNAVKAVVPNMPNVFVFDTSFHQTMPAKAYMYAVPYEYYETNNIRRWGAHGTSHRFVTDRVCKLLGVKPETQKIVTCHIGNGASVSAVDGGKCIDTSMGLTPLEGLMMGTRTGDVDASVVLAIMKSEGLDPDQMQTLLNKKSTCAKWKRPRRPATSAHVWPSRCTATASKNISVPMPPPWADWTPSSSLPVWASTSGTSATTPRRISNSSA